MIFANVRSAIFWGLDILLGGPVRRHLRNIQMVSEKGFPLADHQDRQLKALINHATRTTDYYKYLADSVSLDKYPVVNKIIIRDSYDQFVSSAFKGKKLKVMETSGSTGTPFRVVQNSSKRKRVLAELIAFNALVGYRVGSRHAVFRTVEPLDVKSYVKLFVQNEVEFDVRIQDLVSFERQRKALITDKTIETIIGYSSVLYDLARYIVAHGDTSSSFGVKGVLCISEPLYPEMRETIRKAFDCIVLSRYSNQECGLLAYECPVCNHFHLNTADYIVEVLELDRDVHVSSGTPGRIVVTDLYNYALPLIRYDTGDIGSVVASDCPKFGTPILLSLDGRKLDSIFDTSGRRLAPFIFDTIFHSLNNSDIPIKQFQLIQESSKHYRIRLCVKHPLNNESSIFRQLVEILGEDAEISIEYIDEIPILNSGKRKYLINNNQPNINAIPSIISNSSER